MKRIELYRIGDRFELYTEADDGVVTKVASGKIECRTIECQGNLDLFAIDILEEDEKDV